MAKYAKQNGSGTQTKKRPWIAAILPWKGDRVGETIRKIIFLIALFVFLGTAGFLGYTLIIQPAQVDATLSSVQQIYNSSGSKADKFAELDKINPDIKGWITMNDTHIDGPIVQSREDDQYLQNNLAVPIRPTAAQQLQDDPNSIPTQFYLKRLYTGEESKYGTFFFDSTNSIHLDDPAAKNLIVYGHSMKDNRMFGDLLNFNDNVDYLKARPTFEMDTQDYTAQWKIFAVFQTNTEDSDGTPFNYFRTSFANDSDFLNFVYQIEQRNIYNTGVDISSSDQLAMLSTCAYDYNDWRTVIVARKLRPGESATVDTSNYSKNPNVLYPQKWYDTRGGTMPTFPDTFEDALAQGVDVSWYNPDKGAGSLVTSSSQSTIAKGTSGN